MSDRSNPNSNQSARLYSALFWASLGAGLVGAVITGVGASSLFSPTATWGALTVELLIGLGIGGLIGGSVCLISISFLGTTRTLESFADPLRGITLAWNASATNSEKVGLFFGRMLSHGLFFGAVFVAAIFVLTTFREPILRCFSLAFLTFIIASVSSSLGNLFATKIITPFFKKLKHGTRKVARASMVFLGLLVAFVLLIITINSDELFGAVDPSIPFVYLCFTALLAFTCNLTYPAAFFKRPIHIFIVGVLSVSLGLSLLVLREETLGATAQRGVISRGLYRILSRSLDMDDDGFAWLFGGDCHPFDPRFGPFAEEIPGNGFDENCDGSDVQTLLTEYQDPLDKIKKAPDYFRRKNGNVLFVIVDAARADHLPIYGYKRNTTPAIADLSKNATVFENFFSVTNYTSASMPSILTGLYPSTFPNIHKTNWRSFKLEKKYKSIQNRFNEAGYQTYMYAGHRLGGFLRGFKNINKDRSHRTPASRLSDMALAKLKEIGPKPKDPTLFFVHYIDPHHHYKAPENPARYGRSSADRYDAELAYTDSHLKRILSLVQSRSYKDWLIIVTSDHGENFGEHGTRYHGFNLYDEEVRVPLIMRVPGSKHDRESLAASHLDLVPTIMDFAGLSPDPDLPGRSLLPLFLGEKQAINARRVVFSEYFRGSTQFAGFDGRYSLIYRQNLNRFELYDTKADPTQQKNLYGQISAELLESLLERHISEVTRKRSNM